LFIPALPERPAIFPRFRALFPVNERADLKPEADLRPEKERMLDRDRNIADLLNLLPRSVRGPENLLLRMLLRPLNRAPLPLKARTPPPLKLRMAPPLKLCMPPPLKLRMAPPLKPRAPPPLKPPALKPPPPPPPPWPPASAIATEMVAARRATTATDAIRFSFEFEVAMMRTAGTPLLGPSQNCSWRSDLFGALRRRTKTMPKNND